MPVRSMPQVPRRALARPPPHAGRRQHGDVASDLAQAEVLHQHRPQLFQRALLVFAVHGRAGIDHVAQAGVIPGVDGRMFDQHLDDGGHGEHVAHPMALHQLPDLLGVEARGRRQHGAGGARHLGQQMDAGAVRQRRHGQADVLLGRARHEIAQMIGDHEGHLPMRQHCRFRPPGGAGCEEEPAWIVMLHIDAGRRGAPLRLDQVRDPGAAKPSGPSLPAAPAPAWPAPRPRRGRHSRPGTGTPLAPDACAR